MPIHFEDRQAKYPNRWTMKKSDGTSEVVTLVRNDEPTVEGTPMNAETLNQLSDVAGADVARAEAEAAAQNAQKIVNDAKTDIDASAENAVQKAGKDIDAKAAAALKSIPESYTELDGSVKQIKEDLDSFESITTKSFYQYLQSDKKESGYYWNISDNKIIKAGGGTNSSAIYQSIKLKAGKTYKYSNLYGYFCIIDDGDSLSRLTQNQSGAYSGSYTPDKDVNIYITINEAIEAVRFFVDSTISPPVGVEGYYKSSSKIDKYIHLSVKKDGTGDFLEPISAARSIKDSSENNQYMIDIYDGVYELAPYITDAEKQGNRWGFSLPDYTHLRGIGNVTIDCNLTSPKSDVEVEYISTLNLSGNNNLENITFSGKNVRYVVHDESSNSIKNWKKIIKNCKFIHNGNDDGYWQYTNAWGEGCSSGSVSEFYNCYFENNSYVQPYSFHTNTDFENPCYHKFVNCQFETKYLDEDSKPSIGAFGISDIKSGQVVYVYFIGCVLNGFLYINNANGIEDWKDIYISGYGNSPIIFNVYRPNVETPKTFFPRFTDTTKNVKNVGSTKIEKGRPLFYTNATANAVGVLQENGVRCCGIALEDIEPHSNGRMQFSGYLETGLIGLSVSFGTKLGVENYIVTQTDDNYFAYAINNNLIKFL